MKKIILIGILMYSLNLFADPLVNNDELELKSLNTDIAAAEDRGDRKWLENILASEFAFRRANGVVVGRNQFLTDVKPRDKSRTEVESVNIYGKNRAVVTCIVTIQVDGQDVGFHNVRMFIREGTNWKLLGWANERITEM